MHYIQDQDTFPTEWVFYLRCEKMSSVLRSRGHVTDCNTHDDLQQHKTWVTLQRVKEVYHLHVPLATCLQQISQILQLNIRTIAILSNLWVAIAFTRLPECYITVFFVLFYLKDSAKTALFLPRIVLTLVSISSSPSSSSSSFCYWQFRLF